MTGDGKVIVGEKKTQKNFYETLTGAFATKAGAEKTRLVIEKVSAEV